MSPELYAGLRHLHQACALVSPRRPRGMRTVAGLAALAVFGHIVAVAFVKHPAGLARSLF